MLVLLLICFWFSQWKKVRKLFNIWRSYKAYRMCQIFGFSVHIAAFCQPKQQRRWHWGQLSAARTETDRWHSAQYKILAYIYIYRERERERERGRVRVFSPITSPDFFRTDPSFVTQPLTAPVNGAYVGCVPPLLFFCRRMLKTVHLCFIFRNNSSTARPPHSVGDLEGAGQAPLPLSATDWSRHSRYFTTVLYYGDTKTIASLSLRTHQTWYLEYSKWLPPVAFWQL